MSIRVGDAVFTRSGMPTIVKDRDPTTGKLDLDPDPEHVSEAMRHGYLNGLATETRAALNEILDQVKNETKDPSERVEKLRVKMEELEQDPRNFQLTRYVKAEMTHIMNTYNLRPKNYTMYEGKVK